MKQHDSLEQFLKMRQALIDEREYLLKRLLQLEGVLVMDRLPATPAATPAAMPAVAQTKKPLRAVLKEVLASGPLRKEEILEKVQAKGYVFAGRVPMNSLLPMIYKQCRNLGDGRFAARA